MLLALVVVLAFIIGVVVGAYSHKWLSAEVQADTGLSAAQVSKPVDAAKSAIQSAAKKV